MWPFDFDLGILCVILSAMTGKGRQIKKKKAGMVDSQTCVEILFPTCISFSILVDWISRYVGLWDLQLYMNCWYIQVLYFV